MNYLALCKRLARESRIISGDDNPDTILGNTGDERRIVDWISDAWLSIQTEREDWLFLFEQFTATLVPGQTAYAAADLGISDWSDWIRQRDTLDRTWDAYPTVTGVAEQYTIHWRSWTDMMNLRRGVQNPGRPLYYAIGPDDKLYVHPVPDSTSYTITGWYRRAPQILNDGIYTLDPDAPADENTIATRTPTGIVEEHHMVIVWEAMRLMAIHEEALAQLLAWDTEGKRAKARFYRRYLPRVYMDAEAIA